MNRLELNDVLDTFVTWFTNEQGHQLKSARASMINTVFFMNRSNGQCVNWRNLELIFGIPEQGAKTYLKGKGVNKLTWPKHINGKADNPKDVPRIKKFLANLPPEYIETEGRFKGTRWGMVIYTVAKSTGQYLTKDILKEIAATIAS